MSKQPSISYKDAGVDIDAGEALVERIKGVEREQLVECVGTMAREGWWVEGRRAGLGA